MDSALEELRILDGPNLYFPRAAVKLTLHLGWLVEAPPDAVAPLATAVGLRGSRPGDPRSAFRHRWAARAVAALTRRLAAAGGSTRLAVRARPGADVHQLVVAYPWRRRGTAEALGLAVAAVLDALPATRAGEADLPTVLAQAADQVAHAEPGPPPATLRPRVPVVAITGTNGKTTTARLVAHIGRGAGLRVGLSNTDGIYLDGELVEAGDYSGPSGARTVLADPDVALAVTETARGGILLRGMGTTVNDVSVVTNVSADHLGSQGIDTVDQLAEVKAVVTRVTRPSGWCVVNADDPRTLAMRTGSPARPWAFTRHPDDPAVRRVLDEGGRVSTVLDGWITVLAAGADPDPLVRLVDVPVTLSGLSRFNVENALAAASAALGVGLPRAAVVDGLRSFRPGPEHNPGRMNVYSLGAPEAAVSVVVDLAHNAAGLEALLEIMRGIRPPGGRLLLALGTAGDRQDDVLRALGEIAVRGADDVVIVHKDRYLRGRDPADLEALYRAGAADVGGTLGPAYDDELSGLLALLERVRPGDVVGLMCHQDRPAVEAWLAERATGDDPDTLRAKVLAAAGV